MSSENKTKINQLLTQWPVGTVAVQPWLTHKGYYQQLVAGYIHSSWLVRVGRGAFARAGDKFDWTGGLYAIQQQIGLSIHAGGETALQLQGYGHFLPLGAAPVWLFGQPGEKLPAWYKQYDWGRQLRYFTTSVLGVGEDARLELTDFQVKDSYTIRISSPERAILEVLYHVHDGDGFEHARLLMEGLTTLRPAVVNKLLAASDSVKVNRLFMYLAEHQGHAWVKRLDLSDVDFGSGKRVIVKGGYLDSKYQITVPAYKNQDIEL
jgi:hypothetical protein